ncbi:MAG: HypC/HybG/HupF family hydrogenase formation chaperone [Xanthobacteraceae bacterium]|nr:HypC/HybG/HupF family hydrogenase formation chaperone [Xanthobacteraceae bacterium]
MCLGLPMTIIETDGVTALCERRGEQRRVSVLLLDQPPVGARVLVFIDNAVRLLDADEARLIDDALDGLAAACNGEDFDHLFADLINREPELPEHLRQS